MVHGDQVRVSDCRWPADRRGYTQHHSRFGRLSVQAVLNQLSSSEDNSGITIAAVNNLPTFSSKIDLIDINERSLRDILVYCIKNHRFFGQAKVGFQTVFNGKKQFQ